MSRLGASGFTILTWMTVVSASGRQVPPQIAPNQANLVIDVASDGNSVEFARWVGTLLGRIKRAWSVPSDLASEKAHLVATLSVDRSGVVSDISVVQPSPNERINATVMRVLVESNPADPLPLSYPANQTHLTLTFYINEASTPGIVPYPPGWPPTGVSRPGSGVTLPRLVRDVRPRYTALAMQAGLRGPVLLECVVQVDGSVGEVIVVRSLDQTFGLDREAVTAAKQWQFVAGTREGQPVPVVVSIELTFSLR